MTSSNVGFILLGISASYALLISLLSLFLPYKKTRGYDPDKFEPNLARGEKDFILMKFYESSLNKNVELKDLKYKGMLEATEFTILNVFVVFLGLSMTLVSYL